MALRKRKGTNGESLTPISDATNAYDLLEDMCQAILEEPRRYNQGRWLDTNRDVITSELNPTKFVPDDPNDPSGDRGTYRPIHEPVDPPACGTVGCRAGWLCILNARGVERGINITAIKLLGGKPGEFSDYELSINRLFRGDALTPVLGPDYDELTGTKAYAEAGVEGVREFMKEWEERLKATPVEPPLDMIAAD